MTLNERYIQLLIPYLAVAEGSSVEPKQFKDGVGWVFPCPFCSSKQTKSYKKSNRVGALMPNQTRHSFVYCCSRKQSPECSTNRSFPNFLKMLNPDLFRKYHQEREERGTTGKGHDIAPYNPIFDIGSKPQFKKRKKSS